MGIITQPFLKKTCLHIISQTTQEYKTLLFTPQNKHNVFLLSKFHSQNDTQNHGAILQQSCKSCHTALVPNGHLCFHYRTYRTLSANSPHAFRSPPVFQNCWLTVELQTFIQYFQIKQQGLPQSEHEFNFLFCKIG